MSGGLCQFRDALGRPGEGIHAWRVGSGEGLAGADLLMTAAAAGAIVALSGELTAFRFALAFVVLVIVSVAVHLAFCVDTPLTRWAAKNTPALAGRLTRA